MTTQPLRVLSLDMGTRSMGYALILEPHSIERIGIIDCGSNVSAEAVAGLHNLLTAGALTWVTTSQLSAVVMESQPEQGASKNLSFAMQMFCLLHQIPCVFMAANDKLKVVTDWYTTMPKKTRAERKLISMRICAALLDVDDHNRRLLSYYQGQAYKQRTDIADAVAQGTRWLQRQKKCGTAASLKRLCPDAKQDQLTADAQDQAASAHTDEFAEYDAKPKRRRLSSSDNEVEFWD